ncbi:DUF4124 domain-containing protein [Oceanospirillum beijerinckii]|uniref:DUF4124 domain-containing protein n=1 Tax=Oceanospirillum beijerinckii TaxID=64976 RepID=UPI0004853D90|nr:DUF4124 domain-containing protein [Oceanospirillum beijerinckii]MAC48505.1 DUF4124 domain-containing protein [Oceanospirillum sp.]
MIKPYAITVTLCSILGFMLTSGRLSAASEIYHWKDAEGNPVFSDQPKGQRYLATYQRRYQDVRLVSYQTQMPGQRIIRIYSQPKLQPGDTIELQLNGETYQSPLHSQFFLLHHLPRGHHKVRALVRNKNKRILFTSRSTSLNIP